MPIWGGVSEKASHGLLAACRISDMKCDGFRALLYIEPGRCRFISRNNNVMTRFATLAGQVADTLIIDEAIIDGEIIAADETVLRPAARPAAGRLCRV
jgi:ATP-dependent DNA ligase